MKNTIPFPPDPETIEKRVPVLRTRQPIGDIYIASLSSKLIYQMTYFDVRRVLRDERDVERYLGIQRPLNERRVEELKQYVRFKDATFPTSIIIAIESDFARYDAESNELVISNTRDGDKTPTTAFRNLGRVIDGQHRIAGLDGYSQDNFEVIVSIFVGSDLADQAYVFATVNLEQSKVNKSLAYDLFELANTRSPYKTCHSIAVALDRTKGSPFFERIKRLGSATPGRNLETLTQATFVNALVDYISRDPKGDRDVLLRNKKLEKVSGKEARRYCFRNLFIDEEDVKIGKVVEQYFMAVRERWPRAWNFTGTGKMLNRTNGFRALMKVFGSIYNAEAAPGEFVDQSQFYSYFKRVEVDWDFFDVREFNPGTSGEAALRRFFMERIFDDQQKLL